jgi:hypothetical protein
MSKGEEFVERMQRAAGSERSNYARNNGMAIASIRESDLVTTERNYFLSG